MSTANAAQTLEQADDFSSDYATSMLVVSEGATVLAAYQVAGFVTSNAGDDGLAVANAIAAENNVGTGTADTVKLVAGSKEFDLTIGVDAIISDTSFITGVESSVTGLTVTFPA